MNTVSKELKYNELLSSNDLTRMESFEPEQWQLLTYSKPEDCCKGIMLQVGNMNSHFPFEALGRKWKSVEYLYLCGEWSAEGERGVEIQQDILTAKSGYAAKRFKKSKYKKEIRPDFPSFRHQWMLWCVWQKCLGNKEFCEHLISLPTNQILVELVPRDPVWAAYPNKEGVIVGANAMGKILTICRHCLLTHQEPNVDTKLLNEANIYILGNKVVF